MREEKTGIRGSFHAYVRKFSPAAFPVYLPFCVDNVSNIHEKAVQMPACFVHLQT